MGNGDGRTVSGMLLWASEKLKDAGLPDPRMDAGAIVAAALKIKPTDLDEYKTTAVDRETAYQIVGMIERRRNREPLAYLVGYCTFRNLRLAVDSRVMVPREYSGHLVEIAKAERPGARVHEVGTGSGAICLAIKSEAPGLLVSASDVSRDAIDVARENAKRLGLQVRFTVAAGLPAGNFQLVVANLPYQDTTAHRIPQTPEAHHEPEVATFGGPDGLALIRAVAQTIPPHTRAAFEHAPWQAETVRAMLQDPETIDPPDCLACFTVGYGRG